MHECQVIVKKIHSFKSLIDECMWLIKVVRVFFFTYANYKKYYKLLQVRMHI